MPVMLCGGPVAVAVTGVLVRAVMRSPVEPDHSLGCRHLGHHVRDERLTAAEGLERSSRAVAFLAFLQDRLATGGGNLFRVEAARPGCALEGGEAGAHVGQLQAQPGHEVYLLFETPPQVGIHHRFRFRRRRRGLSRPPHIEVKSLAASIARADVDSARARARLVAAEDDRPRGDFARATPVASSYTPSGRSPVKRSTVSCDSP